MNASRTDSERTTTIAVTLLLATGLIFIMTAIYRHPTAMASFVEALL